MLEFESICCMDENDERPEWDWLKKK